MAVRGGGRVDVLGCGSVRAGAGPSGPHADGHSLPDGDAESYGYAGGHADGDTDGNAYANYYAYANNNADTGQVGALVRNTFLKRREA